MIFIGLMEFIETTINVRAIEFFRQPFEKDWTDAAIGVISVGS
jgi:hypothetical protein